MRKNGDRPTSAPDSTRTMTPAELDLRVHIRMQGELFAEIYSRSIETDADWEKWQADGYAARFTALTKGDPAHGIDPNSEIADLIEKGDLDSAKAKIKAKLLATK